MKFNHVLFFILATLVSSLLTACGAAPLTNWPGITSTVFNPNRIATVRPVGGGECSSTETTGKCSPDSPAARWATWNGSHRTSVTSIAVFSTSRRPYRD